MLNYKSDRYGKEFCQIDQFYPSSQLCSDCGYQNKEVKEALSFKTEDKEEEFRKERENMNSMKFLMLPGINSLWFKSKTNNIKTVKEANKLTTLSFCRSIIIFSIYMTLAVLAFISLVAFNSVSVFIGFNILELTFLMFNFYNDIHLENKIQLGE